VAYVCDEYWQCDRCGKRVDNKDAVRDWMTEHYTQSLLCMPCGGQLKARVSDFCTLRDLLSEGVSA
jgi:hypothetical protein